MNRNTGISMFAAAAMALAGSASAQTFTPISFWDCTTTPSGFLANQIQRTTDGIGFFGYDYGSYVPTVTTAPVVIPIPEAPNTPGGAAAKRGFRMEANNNREDATGAPAAIDVYVTSAPLSAYRLRYDAWISVTGLDGGGTGSSQYTVIGGHATGVRPESFLNTGASSGFFYGFCGDNGFTADYVFYQSPGTTGTIAAQTSVANYLDAAAANAGVPPSAIVAGWAAIFPTSVYQVGGVPGKAWTRVECVVNGTNTQLFFTPTGGTRTRVATANLTTGGNSGLPYFGQWDTNSSVASPVNDQFTVVDNVELGLLVPEAAAADWNTYE